MKKATTIQYVILLILMTIGLVSSASAESSPSPEVVKDDLANKVSAADLVSYAYQNNPSILSARNAWKATVESYRVSSGYPDPQLSVTYFPEPIETRLGPQDWNASLSQIIPFPGKLSRLGEIVGIDAKIEKIRLDKTIRDVTVAVKESYYELLYIREARKVVSQNNALLNHLRKVAETAYGDGHSKLIDVIKAQAQSGQLQYDALLLEDLELTEITRLNGILNRFPEAPLGELIVENVKPVMFTLNRMYELAKVNREEIRIADAKIDKAAKKISLATFQNMPDFKLGVSYSAIGNPDVRTPPPDAGRDAIGIQAGISIPLWFGKNSSRKSLEKARKQQAIASRDTVLNDTFTKIRSIYFRVENADRIMRLYRDNLLPQAARSLEVAESWFKEKQTSFSDFVEAQSVWYNFQLAHIRARADYGKYLARLEKAVGISLTKTFDPLPAEAEKEAK